MNESTNVFFFAFHTRIPVRQFVNSNCQCYCLMNVIATNCHTVYLNSCGVFACNGFLFYMYSILFYIGAVVLHVVITQMLVLRKCGNDNSICLLKLRGCYVPTICSEFLKLL